MRLFLSYSRNDIDAANHIAAELRRRGADVFVDYERLKGGEDFIKRLGKEIKACDYLVLLFSPRSAESKWVQDEVAFARHHNRPIIPVILERVDDDNLDAFFFIIRLEQIDFTRWQVDKQVDGAIRKLAASLGLPEPIISPPAPETSPVTPPPDPAPIRRIQPAAREKKLWKIEDLPPPPFAWCPVSKGLVTLEDASGYGGTKGGAFEVAAFSIAKYPITNAQYQVFVDAPDGYKDAKWWNYSPDAEQWRANQATPENTAFESDNLPRTNVCWYDAVAFCRWLSDKTGENITLPTERQWQQAALGDKKQKYPWGDKIDKTYCNYNNDVGQATPVTQFPKGESPFHVMDMAGNVWEWCLTRWGTDDSNLGGNNARVVRGGSWYHNDFSVRAANRNGYDPLNQGNNIGFRCALLDDAAG